MWSVKTQIEWQSHTKPFQQHFHSEGLWTAEIHNIWHCGNHFNPLQFWWLTWTQVQKEFHSVIGWPHACNISSQDVPFPTWLAHHPQRFPSERSLSPKWCDKLQTPQNFQTLAAWSCYVGEPAVSRQVTISIFGSQANELETWQIICVSVPTPPSPVMWKPQQSWHWNTASELPGGRHTAKGGDPHAKFGSVSRTC